MGKNSTLSLYQTILKEQFNELPVIFQKIHGNPLPQKATGEMVVSYGAGWLAKLCTPFMPIPAKGNYTLNLEIRAHKKGEEWIRSFPNQKMQSIQYIQEGIFYEQFGISSFAFELLWKENKLCFNCQKQYLGIFSLPTFLMVKPHAIASAIDEERWELTVQITFLGSLLAQYKGQMKIEK